MDSQPGDNWFDHIMVFLSKNLVEICEEWFRILGWMLTISALSFGAQQLDRWYLYILPYGSVAMLWLRCMIGYHAKLHSWISKRREARPDGPLGSVRTAVIWISLAVLISLLSGLVLELAMMFATELSTILAG